MHLLCLSQTCLRLPIMQRLRMEGWYVVFGYQPNDNVDVELLRLADAAFPWIAPQIQLAAINPDVILDREIQDEQSVEQAIASHQGPAIERTGVTKQRSLTIIMRSRNDACVIAQTLKALFSQTVRAEKVLLIDSSSTDGTLGIVRHFPVEILSISASEYYPGRVLNRAMTLTNGEFIVFLNSDAVLLTPQSIERLLQPLKEEDVAAVYARQLPRPEAEVWVQDDYIRAFPENAAAPAWMTLSLAYSAFKRSMWQQHPFYTAAWGSEDVEWARWAKSQGKQVLYVSDALCMHSHNYSLKQLYGRRYIEGEADAFIRQTQYSAVKLMRDVAAATVRDIKVYWRHGDYKGLLGIPIRRFVERWGYYRGNCWGNQRKRVGNNDVKTGQNAVLKHYDTP